MGKGTIKMILARDQPKDVQHNRDSAPLTSNSVHKYSKKYL